MPGFKLVPMDVPQKGDGRRSIYDEILEEFGVSKVKSARVDIPDRKPNSVLLGLRKRIATSGSFAGIRAIERSGQIFLVKE